MVETRIPESPESERSLVSCVFAGFRDQDASSPRALFDLSTDAFMVPQSRTIWAAMRSLYQAGQPIDPTTIWCEIQRLGLSATIGSYSGLFEELSFQEFGNPEPLVRELNLLHIRRQGTRLGIDLQRALCDLVEDPIQALSTATSNLTKLTMGASTRPLWDGDQFIQRLVEGKPYRADGKGEKLFHFPIAAWNEALECAPGHVVVVGAAPKTGKTALIIDSMVTTATKGINVGMISLEMDRDEIEARLSGRLTGLNSRNFLRASWTPETVRGALQQADAIKRMCWWCHPSGVPWASVEAQIREMVRVKGVRAVAIDYFTLVGKPTGTKNQNDAALWGMLSMAIKRLAQELGICIVILSQLNRGGQEGEPNKNDLRETGQLEQDANAIILLWKVENVVKGKLSDNRSGPTVDKGDLDFDGATCVFKSGGARETRSERPDGWQ